MYWESKATPCLARSAIRETKTYDLVTYDDWGQGDRLEPRSCVRMLLKVIHCKSTIASLSDRAI